MQSTMTYTQGHAVMRPHVELRPSYHGQENVASVTAQYGVPSIATRGTNRKRKSSPTLHVPASKRTSTTTTVSSGAAEHQLPMQKLQQPSFSTQDLEFDYDRSQLRDPRATPGRRSRPRYGRFDCPEDLKRYLQATRKISVPTKPRGRLNRSQKDELFRDECRMNPFESFHDIYHCYDKGPRGSPTYDEAGFQIDYFKVVAWMKPKAYNKKSTMRNMDRGTEKDRKEREQMFSLFFRSASD